MSIDAAHRRFVLEVMASPEGRALLQEITGTAPGTDDMVGAAETSKLGGWPSRRAMDQTFRRCRVKGAVHPLEAMAVELNGRRWKRADILNWRKSAVSK